MRRASLPPHRTVVLPCHRTGMPCLHVSEETPISSCHTLQYSTSCVWRMACFSSKLAEPLSRCQAGAHSILECPSRFPLASTPWNQQGGTDPRLQTYNCCYSEDPALAGGHGTSLGRSCGLNVNHDLTCTCFVLCIALESDIYSKGMCHPHGGLHAGPFGL